MRPLVMGIVNTTPDSFSDGGAFLHHDDAVAHGFKLVAQGADIVDVGGESTRPGASEVGLQEELDRVIPVVRELASATRVSVDTTKAEVARQAAAAGATILNDVSASLAEVAAQCDLGWVAMHMQGKPRTMQIDPSYQDVVAEVTAYLAERAAFAESLGISEVWIDPGIGFGKTAQHNWDLLRALPALCELGFPVAVGTSRKRFLAEVLASVDDNGETIEPEPGDRLEGSVATALLAAEAGVSMLRVHDVGATVAALAVLNKLNEDNEATTSVDRETMETVKWQ
ncbi:MAG: dihydropteroate synthase [Acidimicrobiales bacterium]|nr:dihydropteroate synthase [Acidimicrobiales bacterium]